MTIVCGDSHTSTHGAFGALAFGIGTSEVEMVLATQTLLQRDPKTYEVRVDGRLAPGVSSKDIILALIARIGVGGGTGHVFEYRGEAIRALTMEQRMTICNMSIEGGARAGLIAPDDTTFEYLHGRAHAPQGAAWDAAVARWRRLPTDDGATYDKSITIDANALEPMVTYGTNPGMGIPITSRVPSPADERRSVAQRRALERALEYMDLQPGQAILGQKVDVVFVGSCTNGRISDLRLAAARAQGPPRRRRRPAHGRAGQRRGEARGRARGPGRDLQGRRRRVARVRLLDVHRDERRPADARPVRGSTSNRNFEGRQGKGGRTFLASPLTAAASAIAGVVDRPAHAARDRDAWPPSAAADAWPSRSGCSRAGSSRSHAENVDTDQIVPARYLKVTDKDGLAEALFRDWRFEEDGSLKDPPFVLDRARHGRPADPARRRQLRGRVRRASTRRGRSPRGASARSCRPASPTSSAATASRTGCCRSSSRRRSTRGCATLVERDPDAELTVDLAEEGVLLPDGSTIDFEIDPFAKRMLLAGTDELGYLLSKEAEIDAWEAAHPPRIDTLAGAR